jgi:hypothetical protein
LEVLKFGSGRRMEKISWTDLVKTKYWIESRERGIIVLTVNRRKANWIGHILRGNCLLKHGIE